MSCSTYVLDPNSLGSRFDPHNLKHVQAYKAMEKTGSWPVAFWHLFPSDTIVTSLCSSFIRTKLADAWVEHKLKE